MHITVNLEAFRQHREHIARRKRMKQGCALQVFSRSCVEEALSVDPIIAEESGRKLNSLHTITRIQYVVSRFYGLKRDDILSLRRFHHLTLPRHVAMYFAKEMTMCSLPEIARRFGGFHHTTVLDAVRKMSEAIENNPEQARDIATIRAMLEDAAIPKQVEVDDAFADGNEVSLPRLRFLDAHG